MNIQNWAKKVDLQVRVYQRAHMRDENLEYELDLGRNVLGDIFDREIDRPDLTHVKFSFPERWMNIVEERSLYNRLELHCPNLVSVHIKTQSVYIIQMTPAPCVGILNYGIAMGDLPKESATGRLWLPMTNTNVFAPGLNVIGGTMVEK